MTNKTLTYLLTYLLTYTYLVTTYLFTYLLTYLLTYLPTYYKTLCERWYFVLQFLLKKKIASRFYSYRSKKNPASVF